MNWANFCDGEDADTPDNKEGWETWKDNVFGVNSKLDDQVFAANVTAKGKWMFKPYNLRQKVFEYVGMPDKHYYEKPKKGLLGLGLIAKARGKDD